MNILTYFHEFCVNSSDKTADIVYLFTKWPPGTVICDQVR